MWAIIILICGLILAAGLTVRAAYRRHQDRIIHEHLRREAWQRVRSGRRRWW